MGRSGHQPGDHGVMSSGPLSWTPARRGRPWTHRFPVIRHRGRSRGFRSVGWCRSPTTGCASATWTRHRTGTGRGRPDRPPRIADTPARGRPCGDGAPAVTGGPRAREAAPRPRPHLLQVPPVQAVLHVAGGRPAHLPAARQEVHVVHPAVQAPRGRRRLSFCACREVTGRAVPGKGASGVQVLRPHTHSGKRMADRSASPSPRGTY